MKPWSLALCAALLNPGVFAAQDLELEAREAALAARLRCVVCQNQTVAESQAPIAKDMRKEIAVQLAQGQAGKCGGKAAHEASPTHQWVARGFALDADASGTLSKAASTAAKAIATNMRRPSSSVVTA